MNFIRKECKDLLDSREIFVDLLHGSSHPVALITEKKNIWSHSANASGLKHGMYSVGESHVVNKCIKWFRFVGAKPFRCFQYFLRSLVVTQSVLYPLQLGYLIYQSMEGRKKEYLNNFSANHKGMVFAHQVGKVHQRSPHVRCPSHDKNLRGVCFDMLFGCIKLLSSNQSCFVSLGLARWSPINLFI